jgi:hypothetical protein
MTDHAPQPSRVSSATLQYAVSLSRLPGGETPRHPTFCRDGGETTAEPGGLKALARLVLARDSRRDGNRGRVSRAAGTIGTPSETPLPADPSPEVGREAATATVLAPRFGQDPAGAEPAYDQPYPARRGAIRRPRGRFEHFCVICGAWGAVGFGVTAATPGRWYCLRHRAAG